METIRMIKKAFGDNVMSAVQIKVWPQTFKDGQEAVESEPCSGCLLYTSDAADDYLEV